MLVKLRNNWFAPGEQRYKKGVDGAYVQIPDHLRKFLPKTAIIKPDDEPEQEEVVEEKVETLADHDEERKLQDEEFARIEAAEKAAETLKPKRGRPRKV